MRSTQLESSDHHENLLSDLIMSVMVLVATVMHYMHALHASNLLNRDCLQRLLTESGYHY